MPDPRRLPRRRELVVVGGDLLPGTLLAAYRHGLFPMPVHAHDAEDGLLGWWSPDPRGVLPLGELVVSRSLRRSLRRYQVTVDTDFAGVVAGCADPRRQGGWITAEIAEAYLELHRWGWAHSVEARTPQGDLVGGLYGVEVGGLFAGESMFSRQPDASKVALVALVDLLRAGPAGPRVLDVQWVTAHLTSLGVVGVRRRDYLTALAPALATPPALT